MLRQFFTFSMAAEGPFFAVFAFFAFRVIKKIAQRFSPGNIFENVPKGLYNAFLQ